MGSASARYYAYIWLPFCIQLQNIRGFRLLLLAPPGVEHDRDRFNIRHVSRRRCRWCSNRMCGEAGAGKPITSDIITQTVPVMGAIMVNPGLDKCLLVKSWGAGGAWGFPRGKIAQDETDLQCAQREVSYVCHPTPYRTRAVTAVLVTPYAAPLATSLPKNEMDLQYVRRKTGLCVPPA